MMDSEDDNSLTFTDFDRNRIDSMGVNDTVVGECGQWSVFRYKEDYMVVLHGKKNAIAEIKRKDIVFNYLKNANK